MSSFNTPSVLAQTPIAALFWTVVAPYLLAAVIVLIFGTAMFEDESAANVQRIWMFQALVSAALFAGLTFWSDAIGAGPFAGEVRTTRQWAVLALWLGPVTLVGSFWIVGTLAGGSDASWAYNDKDAEALMGAPALGVMMALSVVVLAPLIEEIAFRGVALGCLLARGWQPGLAIGLVAALFALTHTQYTPLGQLSVFITGCMLGWLRMASGSLGPPLIAHVSANGVQMAALWMAASAM